MKPNNQPFLSPGQLDDRARRKWRRFNGPQIDPTRQGKRSDTPYFRRGHGRVLMPDDFMPVGQHAGKHLRAVPVDYLLWVDSQPWSRDWTPWAPVHDFIDRFIQTDPETADAANLPIGPIIYIWRDANSPLRMLHCLPGNEDLLHAFAVGALHLKTADYLSTHKNRGLEIPYYSLPANKVLTAIACGASCIPDTELAHHRQQWRTYHQTRPKFTPDPPAYAPTASV